MKKRKLLNIIALLLLVSYAISSVQLYRQREPEREVQGIDIVVQDSLLAQFVTPQIVDSVIRHHLHAATQFPTAQLDYSQIETRVDSIPYVRKAQIYKTHQGRCVVELWQHIPKLRIVTTTGYDFYIDSLGNVLPPLKGYYYPTSVVTGEAKFDFEKGEYMVNTKKNGTKDAIFLEKLINFVEFTERDAFMRNLTTQIYLDSQQNIVLIPRFDGQEILVGEPTEIEEKLTKLKLFYSHLFKKGGWQEISTIDLRYDQQVIVKKK
ncbi:MAG: hypothetical protein R3Y19_00760 [Rikenellaceae bacterium]